MKPLNTIFNLPVRFINLMYESTCSICNNSSETEVVCQKCEQGFIERKGNHIKSFKEIPVYSWGLYSNTLRDGLIKLKNGRKELAKYFNKKLTGFWNTLPSKIKDKKYLVISIPSHIKRVKERGFCPSSLIATEFSVGNKQIFSKDYAIRTKETFHMNCLSSLNDRIININNAFNISDNYANEKDILIIDDILTSGSTICELSRTILKKYPNTNLIGLTVASGDTFN